MKHRIIIAAAAMLCMCLLASSIAAAEPSEPIQEWAHSYDEYAAMEAHAYSYDYSSAPGWGIGYIYEEGSAYEDDEPEETEYPGLSYADLKAHDWIRCWIRIQIRPYIDFVGISGPILSGKAARLTNVRVENFNDVRLFPLKSLYYSATGVELEERGVTQDADEWILELLVRADDSDLLDERLKNARFLFDYVIQDDDEDYEEDKGTVIKDLPIDMRAVERQEYDPQENLVFYLDKLKKDKYSLSVCINSGLFDIDALSKEECDLILTDPDQQVVYNLEVRCSNDSPQPIYGIQACLRENDSIVLTMQSMQNYNYGINNLWAQECASIYGVFIICDKNIPIDKILQTVSESIYFKVSTEAVGKAEFDSGEESIMYLGRRFEVGINTDTDGEAR